MSFGLFLDAPLVQAIRHTVPTVFLSYRHESPEHSALVRNLGDRLESRGITVLLDQFAQEREFNFGGPDRGWPHWCRTQAGNEEHKILIIASPGWFRCYDGVEKAGTGLGAAAEAGIIDESLYTSAGVSRHIRLVTFAASDPVTVSPGLQRYHRFADPEAFADLCRWLSGPVVAALSLPALSDWPEAAPSLTWPVADHTEVRDAFASLMTRSSPHRFLSIRGESDTGKSHLTKQILGNASRIPGLRCGRFDFKGTNDVEAEFLTFTQHLGVLMPTGTVSFQFRTILSSLASTLQPTVLVFDTFELAGEAERWVKDNLLTSLHRSPWLRVVVTGQKVPQAAGEMCAADTAPLITLKPPSPEEWLSYGQPHKPRITLEFVSQVYDCCGGSSSILAQVLGPAA